MNPSNSHEHRVFTLWAAGRTRGSTSAAWWNIGAVGGSCGYLRRSPPAERRPLRCLESSRILGLGTAVRADEEMGRMSSWVPQFSFSLETRRAQKWWDESGRLRGGAQSAWKGSPHHGAVAQTAWELLCRARSKILPGSITHTPPLSDTSVLLLRLLTPRNRWTS